jgi:hypothetical protein
MGFFQGRRVDAGPCSGCDGRGRIALSTTDMAEPTCPSCFGSRREYYWEPSTLAACLSHLNPVRWFNK